MGRFNRVVAIDVPHHVTQRGNGPHFILDCDADRTVYLKLLREDLSLYGVELIGYCLMSNHVHLIAIPRKSDGLAQALEQTHGRYASYWNVSHQSSGHVRQGRYYSCPLDEAHLWEALRYTELNPLRARLVAEPDLWRWSSAAIHCGVRTDDEYLALEMWRNRWTAFGLAGLSRNGGNGIDACRHSPAHSHRPAAGKCRIYPWTREGNATTANATKARAPRKIVTDRSQGELSFDP